MSQTVISNAAIVINTDKSVREIRALLESLNTLSTPISSLITILGNLDKQGGSGLSNLKTNLEQVATVGGTVATNFRRINTALDQIPQNIEKTATSLSAVQEKLTNLVKSSLHIEVTANTTQIDSLQQKVAQLITNLKLLQKASTNADPGASRMEKLTGRFQGLKKEIESIIEIYKKLQNEINQNVGNLGTPKFDRAGLETNLGLLSDLSIRATNAYQAINLLGIGINSLTSKSESTKQLQENFTDLQRVISLTSESLRKDVSSGTGISELTLLEKITSDNKRQFIDFRDTITDSITKIKEDFKLLKTDEKFITTEASQEEIARLAGAVVAAKEKFADFNIFLSRLNFKNLDDQIEHIKTILGSGAETNPLVKSLIELRDLVTGFQSGNGLSDGISPFKNMTAELSAVSKQTGNLSNAWNKVNSEELDAENKLKDIQEVLKVIQKHVNEDSLASFKKTKIDKLVTDEIKLQNVLGSLKSQFASFYSELQNTAGFEALDNKIKQLESSIEEASLKIKGFRTAYSKLKAEDVFRTAATKGIEGDATANALKESLKGIENIIQEIGTSKDAVNITAQLKESQDAAKVLESDLIRIKSQLKTLLNSATLNKQPLIKQEVLQIYNKLSAELTTLQAKQKELATQAAPKLNLLNFTEGLSKANDLFNQLLKSVIEFEKETRSSNFGKTFVNVEDLRKMLLDGRAVNSELTAMRNKLLNLRTKIDLLPESSRAGALQAINKALGEIQNTAVRLAPSLSIINRQIQSFGDMPALPAGFGGYALSLRQMTSEGAKLSTLFDKVGRAVRNVFGTNASAQVDQYRESFKHLEEQLIQFRSGVVIWSIGLQMLGQSILKPITEATTHFLELSDTMAMVKGVMNATGSAFEQLQQTAITWGAVTRFTSQEVAQGLLQLGKAGFTAAQAMQVLPATLNLAQAAGIDLARSTEIVSNITQGFEISLERLPYAADVLTKAFTTSNATLENLGYGMAYVGSLAKGFGVELEDVVGALAKLNTAGLKGCHDDKTEILTKDRGFVLFKDLVPDDQVMTINKDTLQMEWQHTDGKIYEFDIDEPIFRIKSKYMDYAVTDNHRLFIETRSGTRKIVEAKDFTEGKFFRTGLWQGENKDTFILPGFIQDRGNWKKQVPNLEIPMRDWVDFLGWYFSEGSLCKDNGGNYKVTVSQSDVNISKVTILTKCLQKLPFRFNKSGVNFACINQQLYKELLTYGKGFNNLHIPQYIKDLPVELLHIFLDSFTLGDGDAYGKIYVSNSVLADDIYEILLKCGYGAYKKQCIIKGEKRKIGDRIITATQDGYWVSRTVAYNKPFISVNFENKKDLNKQQVFWEHYKGKVYSVSVPNTLVFVRRNGKGVFSGNTLAGTALRGVLDALFNPTKDEARLMQDLANRIGDTSFSLKNANGDFIGFVELIKKLEQAGMTSEEALRLFGQRAGPGAAALLRVGSKALEDYIDQLKLSEGTTARIGKNAEESLKGRVLIMTSAFEGLQEVFGKSLEAPLRAIVDTITVFLNKFQTLHEALGPVAVLFDRIVAGLAVLVSGLGAATFSWFLLLVPAIQFVAFAHTLIGLMSGMITAGKGVGAAMNTAAVGTAAASTATWGLTASLDASTGAVVENTIATAALGTAQKSQAASAAVASIAQAKNNAALLLGSRIAENTFTLFTQLKEIVLGTISIIGLGIANSFIAPLKGAYLQVGSFAGVFTNLKGVLERTIIVSRIFVGVLGVSIVDSLKKMQVAFAAYKASALTSIATNGLLSFSLSALRSSIFSLVNGFIYLARLLVTTPVGWIILLVSLFSSLKEPLTIVNAELEKQQDRLKATENSVISYGKVLQNTISKLQQFSSSVGASGSDAIGNRLTSQGTLQEVSNVLDSFKELGIAITQISNDKGFVDYFASIKNEVTGANEEVLVFSTNASNLDKVAEGLDRVLGATSGIARQKTLEIQGKLLQNYVDKHSELVEKLHEIDNAYNNAVVTKNLQEQNNLTAEHSKLLAEKAGVEKTINEILTQGNLTEKDRAALIKASTENSNLMSIATQNAWNNIKGWGQSTWEGLSKVGTVMADVGQSMAEGLVGGVNSFITAIAKLTGYSTTLDKTLLERKKVLEDLQKIPVLDQAVADSWNKFTKNILQTRGALYGILSSVKDVTKSLEEDFTEASKGVEKYVDALRTATELKIAPVVTFEKEQIHLADTEAQKRLDQLKQSTNDEHKILLESNKIITTIERQKLDIVKDSTQQQINLLEESVNKRKGLVDRQKAFEEDKTLISKKQSIYEAALTAEKQFLDKLLSMRENLQNKIRALAAERFDFKQSIADIKAEFEAHTSGFGKLSEIESDVTNFKRKQAEIRKLIDKGEFENARKLIEQNKRILESLVKSPEKLSLLGTDWKSQFEEMLSFVEDAEEKTGDTLQKQNKLALEALNESIDITNSKISELVDQLKEVAEALNNLGKTNFDSIAKGLSDETLKRLKQMKDSLEEATAFTQMLSTALAALGQSGFEDLIKITDNAKQGFAKVGTAVQDVKEKIKNLEFKEISDSSIAVLSEPVSRLEEITRILPKMKNLSKDLFKDIDVGEIGVLLLQAKQLQQAYKEALKAAQEDKNPQKAKAASDAFTAWNVILSQVQSKVETLSNKSTQFLSTNFDLVVDNIKQNIKILNELIKEGENKLGKDNLSGEASTKLQGLLKEVKNLRDKNIETLKNALDKGTLDFLKIDEDFITFDEKAIEKKVENVGKNLPSVPINYTPQLDTEKVKEEVKDAATLLIDSINAYFAKTKIDIPNIDTSQVTKFFKKDFFVPSGNRTELNTVTKELLENTREVTIQSTDAFNKMAQNIQNANLFIIKGSFEELNMGIKNAMDELVGNTASSADLIVKKFDIFDPITKKIQENFVYITREAGKVDLSNISTVLDSTVKNVDTDVTTLKDTFSKFNDIKNVINFDNILGDKLFTNVLKQFESPFKEGFNFDTAISSIETLKSQITDVVEAANKNKIDGIVAADYSANVSQAAKDLTVFEQTIVKIQELSQKAIIAKNAGNTETLKILQIAASELTQQLPYLGRAAQESFKKATDSAKQVQTALQNVKEESSIETEPKVLTEVQKQSEEAKKKLEETAKEAERVKTTLEAALSQELVPIKVTGIEEVKAKIDELLKKPDELKNKTVALSVDKDTMENVDLLQEQLDKLKKQNIKFTVTDSSQNSVTQLLDVVTKLDTKTKQGLKLQVSAENISQVVKDVEQNINIIKEKNVPLTFVANKEATLQEVGTIFTQAQALTAKGVKVNVDFSAVSENLRKIRTELETKTSLKPTVELNEVDKAKAKVRELSRQIEIVDKMSGSVSLFSDPQIALLDLMLDRLDQMLVLLGNAAKESNLEENLGPSITALQNNFTSLATSIKESLQQAFNSLDFSQLINFINTIVTQLSGLVALITIQFSNMSEFESFRQKWEALKDKPITLTVKLQGEGAGVIAAKTGGFISEPIRLFGQGGLNFFRPSYSKVPGNGVGDHVPALLEPGEFIIRKSAVKQVGLSFLDALNRGNIAFHQAGGEIASLTQRLSSPNVIVKKFIQGGAVTSNKLDFVDVNLTIGTDPKPYKVKGAREEVASLVAALKKVQRGA